MKKQENEKLLAEMEEYASDMSMALSLIAGCSEKFASIKAQIAEQKNSPVEKAPVQLKKKDIQSGQIQVTSYVKQPISVPEYDGVPQGRELDMVIMEGGKLIQSVDDCEFSYTGDIVSISNGEYTLKKTIGELNTLYNTLPVRSTKKDFDNKRAAGALMRFFAFSGDYNSRMLEIKGQYVLVKV